MTQQTLIKFIIGTFIVLFVIWNRFFRQRGPSVMFVIPIKLILFINFLLIFFFLYIFIKNIKHILQIEHKSILSKIILNNIFVQKLNNILKEYLFASPQFLYRESTKNLDLAPILELPASYFTVYCYYPRIIIIGFLQIPLIIVATTFLIDTIFSNNLINFFHSLTILIPMLFMRVWIFLLESYSTRRLDHIYQFLDVIYLPNEKRFSITLKPEHQLPVSDIFPLHLIKEKFLVLCNFWEIYSKIYSFMKHIDSIRNSYDPYVQVYTSLCFCLGWIIQLMIILFNF